MLKGDVNLPTSQPTVGYIATGR